MEIPLSIDLLNSELPDESTLAQPETTTHMEQLTDQNMSSAVIAQSDLHKLADVAFNESAMILSEEQGESVSNQQPTDTDKVVDLLKLDDFYCLLSTSSSDSSTSAKSSPPSSTSNISSDQKIEDIIPCTDFADARSDNPTITPATTTLLDFFADLPAVIKTMNLLVRFVQENFVTIPADATIQRSKFHLLYTNTADRLELINSKSALLQADLSALFDVAKKGEMKQTKEAAKT